MRRFPEKFQEANSRPAAKTDPQTCEPLNGKRTKKPSISDENGSRIASLGAPIEAPPPRITQRGTRGQNGIKVHVFHKQYCEKTISIF